jgi:hypothetical protein
MVKLKKEFQLKQDSDIPFLNLSTAYIYSAEILIEEYLKNVKKKDSLLIYPIMYLLQHSFELSLKSIYISHKFPIEQEHNLEKLVSGSISFANDPKHEKEFQFLKELAGQFTQTNFGEGKILKQGNKSNLAFRYYEEDLDYKKLKSLEVRSLLNKIKTARIYCEMITIKTRIGVGWIK